jgi:hypothetical protein
MDVTVNAGHGSYVVREAGGRIIELTTGGGTGNVFFGGLGGIAGGDRMWLAPEVAIFYDGAPTADAWRCPPELDPGDWTMERNGDAVELRQTALGARMQRTVSPLQGCEPAGELPWSGYRTIGEVETSARLSAWQLLMLPAPGEVFMRAPSDSTVYYPPVPATDGSLRADGQPPRWKVGFQPPADDRCVLAALFDADPGALIALTTTLPRNSTYIDVPPEGGDAAPLQVFDSDGDGFFELEVHAPLETRRIESEVVAVWGSRADRMSVMSRLIEP